MIPAPAAHPLPLELPLTITLTEGSLPGVKVLNIQGSLCGVGWSTLAVACETTPGAVRVLDFTGVTHCGTAMADAAAFGRRLVRDAMAKGGPCHVLIAPGDLIFGFCRMIQMTLDTAGLAAGVFRSLPSGMLWLEKENRLPGAPTV